MKKVLGIIPAAAVILAASAADAHSLRAECKKMSDTDVVCRAVFTDGKVSPNATVQVFDETDKVLASGKTDARGQYGFKAPTVEYHVVVQTSQRHVGSISSVDFW